MKNIIILLFTLIISGSVFGQKKERLNPRKFSKAVKQTEVVILDVRTPEEFSNGHIRNAINMDWNNFEGFSTEASLLLKNVPVYVYCHSGLRSEKASKWLRLNGFDQVKDLRGGFEAWKKSDKPITRNKN